MNFNTARYVMVERQLRPWGITDSRILAVMGEMPRENFVPEPYQNVAYADLSLPIENGHVILTPKEHAKMLQSLAIQSSDRVLEIGTGSGYGTALLAKLAEGVVTVDMDAAQSERAKARLKNLELVENIEWQVGDGLATSFEPASFDAVIVNASLSQIPESLKNALRVGGRLCVMTGNAPCMQATLVTRVSLNYWQETVMFETVVPRLVHGGKLIAFEF